MKYLRSSDEEWTVFVDDFDNLSKSYNDIVNLAAMNLPSDWKVHLTV